MFLQKHKSCRWRLQLCAFSDLKNLMKPRIFKWFNPITNKVLSLQRIHFTEMSLNDYYDVIYHIPSNLNLNLLNPFRTTRFLLVQKLSFFQALLPLGCKTTCRCPHVNTTCSFQGNFGDTGFPMVLKGNKYCLGSNGI